MGFTKTSIPSSFILLLLLVSSAAAAAPVSPFCGTADLGSQALCTQMVGAAKTWAEAMTNAINAAKAKAKLGIPIANGVGGKLPPTLPPQSKESIAKTCQESYDRIFSVLDECLGYVKNDPTAALKPYLSSVTYSDCTMVLGEFEISSREVDLLDKQLLKLAGVLIAVSDKRP